MELTYIYLDQYIGLFLFLHNTKRGQCIGLLFICLFSNKQTAKLKTAFISQAEIYKLEILSRWALVYLQV